MDNGHRGRGFEERNNEAPTAICGNLQCGLPTCSRGHGNKCYWNGICSSQMQLDNPEKRTLAAEVLYKRELAKARGVVESYDQKMLEEYGEALAAAVISCSKEDLE